MAASAGSKPSVPPFIPNEREHRRQIAQWIIRANAGGLNNTGTVTLGANVQSTSVTDTRVGPFSFIGFMPTTANAASEGAAGTMFVSTRGDGFFAITHASAASADRTFFYAILG